MSPTPAEGPGAEGPGEEVPAEGEPGEPAQPWEPEGLALARAVAASVAASSTVDRGRRRRFGGSRDARRRDSRPERASGAGPDDRDPQVLDATVDRMVAERGWETDIAVAGALARWGDIVGPEMAAHCRAERYADSELTVRADSTSWATQVRLLAPTVVRRLNEELGEGTVRRVNVVGPSPPNWRKGSRGVRGGRGPRDTYG